MEKDNIVHDFKTQETFNTLTYLQKKMNTMNLNQIAIELQNMIGLEYQKVDIQAVIMAIEEALERPDTTNDRTFEDCLKKFFDVQFVKFDRDSITIANKTISFGEIGISHSDIVKILMKNRKKRITNPKPKSRSLKRSSR